MATDYQKWIEVGEKFDLKGQELKEFVSERQAEEREERANRRDEESKTREIEIQREREDRMRREDREERESTKEREERESNKEREERERESEREHELSLKKLELESSEHEHTHHNGHSAGVQARVPRLPTFNEKDNMDAYLARFERFAKAQNWTEDQWSVYLSALLTGEALEVYHRMAEDDCLDYTHLKEALLFKYQLTKEGFRDKFKQEKPKYDETPSQFVLRIGGYLDRWIELAKIEKRYEDLREMILKEQFLSSCDKELHVYLDEHNKEDLNALTELAKTYLAAHGRNLSTQMRQNEDKSKMKCNRCQRIGHISSRCKTVCQNCHKIGHITSDCRQAKSSQNKSQSNQFPNKSQYNKQIEGRECYICHRKGHIARDCRNKFQYNKQTKLQ